MDENGRETRQWRQRRGLWGLPGSTAPYVLTVLLNWESHEETARAVEAVLGSDYPNFRVLIVDNGSSSESVAAVRQLCSDRVDLIETGRNTGYTGGCNRGLEQGLDTGAAYVWLLNNDTVVEPGTLGSLVTLAESDKRIGLVTPMIGTLEEKSRITFAGGVIQTEPPVYNETNDPKEAGRWAERYPGRELALGTAMLVRTSMVREIGLLDEGMFAYFEDIDYSVRSIAAGYRNAVDRRMVVRHHEKNRLTNPLGMKPHYWYYTARNESRFWRKHLSGWERLRMQRQGFQRAMRNWARVPSQPVSRQAILAGVWHGWMGREGAYDPDARMPPAVAALCRIYGRNVSGVAVPSQRT